MNAKPKVGLLPLYLALYDEVAAGARRTLEPFYREMADALAARGLEVVRGEICRVADEFARELARFEAADVDAIVTLHLAYSPSLESAEALARTRRPLIFLDTTPDAEFGPQTAPERLMYNHGVHGVMDLASVLRRRGRAFRIAAGPWREGTVLDRTVELVRAARAAREFRPQKALRVGPAFRGMGDFAVAEEVLRAKLGLEVETLAAGDLAADVARVTDADVHEELTRDRKAFECALPEEVHARSVRVGLGLRRRLKEAGAGAFSMNFLAFDQATGPVDTVPFLEASKAMARGIGYAGEGDVMTAALVGALQRGFGQTTFTEIFCPDWRGEGLFLSHMGEVNPEVAADRPRLVEKPFPYTPARPPAVLVCAPKPGQAVLVDLAPGPGDSFRLLISPVEVLGDSPRPDMRDIIRGWIKPARGAARFLEEYSRGGGTHHHALVLGRSVEALEAFADFAGLECRTI